MLRLSQQSLTRKVVHGSSSRRWYAAAKKAHHSHNKAKRSLNPDQLSGAKPTAAASAPKAPAAAPAPPTAAAAAGTTADGGGSSSLLPFGIVGLLAVGGGAAYYLEWFGVSLESSDAPIPNKEAVAAAASAASSAAVEQAAAAAASANKKEAAPIDGAGGGRGPNSVRSIAIPSKMKNTAAAVPVTVIEHPERGHRVTGQPTAVAAETPVPVENVSATTRAVQALQAEQTAEAARSLVESHQSAMSDTASNFGDLDSLTITQLRSRIVQLSAELKDRTKWEAVRLKEFLTMKEKETADKYLEILQTQRLEFEAKMATKLREQEYELQTEKSKAVDAAQSNIASVLNQALEAQAVEHAEDKKAFEEIITAEIQSAAQEKLQAQLQQEKQTTAETLQQNVAALTALQTKLAALETALQSGAAQKEGSARAHRLSAAALALAEKLETAASAGPELQALARAAGNTGVIATACATIPESVSKGGVPTLAQLQARYAQAHKKARQAALVPAGRLGLEGQLAGMLFAAVKYPPAVDDPAPADTTAGNAEYVLVRAADAVQNGQLETAVTVLEQLDGQAAYTLADWKKDAIDRISVEKALKVIKMECALLNESCLED